MSPSLGRQLSLEQDGRCGVFDGAMEGDGVVVGAAEAVLMG